MTVLVSVLLGIVRTALYVISLAMLARAILSWFPLDEESRLVGILLLLTEPFVHPIRSLLDRFETFRNSPIDLSFTIAATLILILTIFV
jgi:uncharacterized protein YggT (Ycf19 family)